MNLGWFFSSMRLRQKIILLAVGSFVTLWLAAAWMGYRNYSNAILQIDQKTSMLATAVSRQTEAALRIADRTLVAMRGDGLTKAFDPDQIQTRHGVVLSELMATVSVVDAQGNEIPGAQDSAKQPVLWGSREFFRFYRDGGADRMLVNPPVKDPITGAWNIELTRPLLENGRFAGVLVLSMNSEYFTRFFQTEALGQQGLMSMVGDNGTLLARSREPGRFYGEVIRNVPFLAPNAPIAANFRQVAQLDGVSRSYGFVRLPGYQVSLVVGLGADEQLAPLSQQRIILMAIALSVNLLFFVALRALLNSIARREKVEQYLRESQGQYQGLVESLPMGVLVHREGKFLYLNPAAVAICGAKSPQELVGTMGIDRVHPDFREIALARIQRSLETGTPMPPYEEKFLKMDGTVIDVEIQGKRIIFEGEPAIQSSFQDITERKKMLQALYASEEKWRSIIANSVTGISIFGMNGLLEKTSIGALKMFGYDSEEEIVGRPLVDFVDTSSMERVTRTVDDVLQGRSVGLIEGLGIQRDGTRFYAEAQVDVLRNAQGEPIQLIFITRDTTEHRRAQDELRLAASVFTHAREGIVITDANANIVAANETFSHITGYHRSEVLGKNPRMFNSGRQAPEFYDAMWKTISEAGHWSGEIWNRRKSGEMYAEMLTISAVLDDDGKPQNYVALFTDITPMKEYQSQLERVAHYDALTGLPNRVLFADRLRQAVVQSQRRQRSLGVVYLDLDGFKAVNDAHGHAVGDELLIVLAQRMKLALRDVDSLARLGGDEFVAVLVDMENPQDCVPVLERLLEAASAPVAVQAASGPVLVQVSASIGATIYPRDGVEADLLMRHADQAMYVAKQSGKNRFHLFDSDRDAAVQIQRESVDHIQHALQGNELVLHYQPKVNLFTHEVLGVEALIRWQHPERGLLAPAEFLPVIENHPLSVEVGEWVMDTALTQIAQWKALGLELTVSVNMGAHQLQQDGFVERLKERLVRHPLVPRFGLELEILETSALEDLAKVSGILHACREVGVLFSLDDFGTGYSSLTYLKHLPAHTLKVDQSFVRGMLDDPDDRAIVSGVIGLAAAFGREVVAEGAETQAHCEALIAMGCPIAQGYGIARPMPPQHMAQWVADWLAKKPA